MQIIHWYPGLRFNNLYNITANETKNIEMKFFTINPIPTDNRHENLIYW